MAYDRNEVQAYITEAARRRGIDPATALRVIKQESGFNPAATNLSPKEKSYGLMQLNTQGGLGVHALEKGIDIRNPETWRQQVDFGLDTVAKDGWRQWYGARDVGIGRWDGIRGSKPVGPGAQPDASPLTQAMAERGGSGASTLAGGPGGDQIASGGAGPAVNIGLPGKKSTKLAEALAAQGAELGNNARNPMDAIGGLAQVWAGDRAMNRIEEGEQSALQKALASANLDPSFALAAQLGGDRESLAGAIMGQEQTRTSAANRAQEQAWRQDERTYSREQDANQNARADRTLDLQTAKANAPPETPSSVREYQFAQQQGFPGSYAEWEQQNRKAGATVVNTGQDEGEFQKKAAGKMVDRFGTIAESATAAANVSQTIPVMRELLTQAPTGPIAGRLAERFPGFSTAGDAFQATINQIAPTLRVPGSGATSDRDIDILMASFPRLRNNEGANDLIMGVFEKKAQINLQRSEIATRALRGEIQPAEADRQIADLDRLPVLDDAMRASLTGQQPQQRTEGGVPVGGMGGVVPGQEQRGGDAAPVRRARNPQTGQVLELRNGQWVPAP